jgi:hypothetical protein
MQISSNYSSYNRSSGPMFREFAPRQQYQIIDKLVKSACSNEDPKGEMEQLSRQLEQRHVSYLNVSLVEASIALNKPGAGDPVKELAKTLGIDEAKVDGVLGSYAEELAKETNPQRNNFGGGLM